MPSPNIPSKWFKYFKNYYMQLQKIVMVCYISLFVPNRMYCKWFIKRSLLPWWYKQKDYPHQHSRSEWTGIKLLARRLYHVMSLPFTSDFKKRVNRRLSKFVYLSWCRLLKIAEKIDKRPANCWVERKNPIVLHTTLEEKTGVITVSISVFEKHLDITIWRYFFWFQFQDIYNANNCKKNLTNCKLGTNSKVHL